MKSVLTILSLAFTILVASCDSEKAFDCNCKTSHLTYNDSVVDAFIADTASLNFKTRVYGVEPLDRSSQESYRLQMSHSFSRYTQFYTFSKSNYGGILEVQQYLYDKESEETLPDKNYSINLSLQQWEDIKATIDSSCYWSNKIGKDICWGCTDGGTWLLEGYDPKKRNCANRMNNVDACSYGSSKELGKLCNFLRKYAEEDRLDVCDK